VKNDCNYDCNLSNADLLNYVNMVLNLWRPWFWTWKWSGSRNELL